MVKLPYLGSGSRHRVFAVFSQVRSCRWELLLAFSWSNGTTSTTRMHPFRGRLPRDFQPRRLLGGGRDFLWSRTCAIRKFSTKEHWKAAGRAPGLVPALRREGGLAAPGLVPALGREDGPDGFLGGVVREAPPQEHLPYPRRLFEQGALRHPGDPHTGPLHRGRDLVPARRLQGFLDRVLRNALAPELVGQ